MIIEKSLRILVEEQKELDILLAKLDKMQAQKIENKLQESLNKVVGVRKDKPSFQYNLETIQKKKHLLQFFGGIQKVNKSTLNESLSQQYYGYTSKMYESNSQNRKVQKDPFTIKNPLFKDEAMKRKLQLELNRLNYVAPKEQHYLGHSVNILNKIKRDVIEGSNVDQNILAIKKLYDLHKLDEVQVEENNQSISRSLKMDLLIKKNNDSSMQSSFSVEEVQQITSSRSNQSSNQGSVLIRSKHNMFRLKPDKPHLLQSRFAQNNKTKIIYQKF